MGIGAVISTKFTWPKDTDKPVETLPPGGYVLTPEKEALWRKWVTIYKQGMLPKGEYLGQLYDIGFDKPEAHAISKDGALHYAFYAERWDGKVELRGLGAGRYRVRDVFNDRDLGAVDAKANTRERAVRTFPAGAGRTGARVTCARAGNWVVYALITVALWGVWGALAGLSAQHGFPDTLVYCVWSLTMIPPALVVLAKDSWKLDISGRAVAYGLTIGLLGAGGQMLLFKALTIGPAYFIFPIISLSPAITIAMSFLLLRERTGKLGALGIVLALAALPLFDLSFGQGNTQGLGWFALALLIMAAWGVQAYFMKLANNTVSAASIFFYMMVGGLLLAPVAWAWTDFSAAREHGLGRPVDDRGNPDPERRRRAHAGLRVPLRQGHGRGAAHQCRRAAGHRRAGAGLRGRGARPAQDPRAGAGAGGLTTAGDRTRTAGARDEHGDGSAERCVNLLRDLIARHKQGDAVGVTSICSAHPIVIEASLRHAQSHDDGFVLFEATCNQVNQDGGYTGHVALRFRRFRARHRGAGRLRCHAYRFRRRPSGPESMD